MPPKTGSLDGDRQWEDLLTTLADEHCRFVRSYFEDATEDHASVDDLATALARRTHADDTRVAVRLHHVALPKLDDVGVVDYDARTRTVRYHGHARLDQVQECLLESSSAIE